MTEEQVNIFGATDRRLKKDFLSSLPPQSETEQYARRFADIDRRSRSLSVYQVDEGRFPSSNPRPSHWSIAWSDLMMTMFILFLSMFTYQLANEDFLQKTEPEIIGGDTTEALLTLDDSSATLPFPPIKPGVPLITGGVVKKVEPVPVPDLDPDDVYPEPEVPEIPPAELDIEPEDDIPPPRKMPDEATPQPAAPEKIAIIVEKEQEQPPVIIDADIVPSPEKEIQEPRPLQLEEELPAPSPQIQEMSEFQEIYTLSKDALEREDLDAFASVDLVPDKTMRIILTSDLLFGLGQSTLSDQARQSLRKIGSVIRFTPYMINVVGHTDNIPMRSNNFASNWELSVARASTVARFLIDELAMNPNQFVVSGFSSYRPLVPNTTAENRARNRRVEIIISKRLPKPEPATAENLN